MKKQVKNYMRNQTFAAPLNVHTNNPQTDFSQLRG